MLKIIKGKLRITEDQKRKCTAIIYSHTTMCGNLGMIQIPLADNAVVTPVLIAMIIVLGTVFDQKISKTVAMSILTEASSSLISSFGKFIPILGNVINTATLTEAIGWMAVDRLSQEKFSDDFVENKQSSTENIDATTESDVSNVAGKEDEYLHN